MVSIKLALLYVLKRLGLYHPLQSFYRSALRKRYQQKLYRDHKAYQGSGFTCNCCGAVYSKFAPYYPSSENAPALAEHNVVAGYGEHVYCPQCMSTNRERLVVAVLGQLPPRRLRVLHFSPEQSVFEFLQKHHEVITVDLMPGFYRYIDPHIRYADATALPFPDASFDLVIGNHIMEHIPNDRQALKEIFRVLKGDGQALLQVPFSHTIASTLEIPDIQDEQQQSALFGQKDHVRIYQLNDYLERLRSAGFIVSYHTTESLAAFHQYAIQAQEGFIGILKPGRDTTQAPV